MKKKTIWFWIVAAFFVVLSVGFFGFPGYRFSGFLCLGAAALVLCYWFFAIYPCKTTKWLRRILTIFLILGLLAAAVTGVCIANAGTGDDSASCEYVIVLGAGVNGTQPSLILWERLQATLAYLQSHKNAICVVSGGQGSGEDITEAACMQTYLTEHGIDPERIWMEEKATSTWENIRFSLDLIEEKTGQRPKTAGIVSNEFHLYRAGLIAKRQQLTGVGIPAETSWVSLRVNYFLREIVAVWKLIILGS